MTDYAKILIDEALKESGWQCNFAFPIASDENKYLINLLSEVKVKTHVLEEEAIGYRDRNAKLRTHLALVQNERSMTEAILLERQKEIESINHDVCLAEREIGRTGQDLKKMQSRRKEVTFRIGALENEIFMRTNELSSIKTQLDCDQQTIDAYLESCEEDVSLRERLAELQQADDSRFAYLNSEAGRLSDRRRDVRRKLDVVVSKNDVMKLRIAAAAEKCRAENKARREVLRVWENCVSQIIKREEDYNNLSKQYDELSEQINDQMKRVEEAKKMIELVQDDIKNTEKAIADTNKDIWNTRCQLQELTAEVKNTEEELQTLQKTLERTEHDFRSAVAQSKQTKHTADEMRGSLQKLLDKIKALEAKLAEVQDKRLTVEQLSKLAEEKLSENEKCQRQAFAFQKQLVNHSLKVKDHLVQLNQQASVMEATLSGASNALKGLKKKSKERETELFSLDELIYKSQLYNQRLEHRIAKLETDPLITQEEMDAKNKQINALQAELDMLSKSSNTLTSMINQFMNDKRICKMRTQKIQDRLDKLNEQLDTSRLILTNTKNELRKQEAAWREMLVECNVNRHQVKRMEGKLKLWRNKVMTEENKQIQLEALERETDVEVNGRKTKISLELRQAESMLSDTRSELTGRQRRLELVKARYNTTVTAIKTIHEDALQNRMTYLIEALQRRQELKNKGDILDAEVRRAEEELRALENTVVVMTSLNEYARGKLLTKTTEEPLVAQKKDLEAKVEEAQQKLMSERETRRKLRGNIMHYEMQIEELNSLLDVVRERARTALIHVDKASRTVDECKQRCERTNKLLNQVMDKLERSHLTNEEDIEVRLLRDFNRLIQAYYDRCLHNSAEVTDELIEWEQKLADRYSYRKSITNTRSSSIRSKSIVRGTSSTSEQLTSLPVVSLNERVSLPPINLKPTGSANSKASTGSESSMPKSIKS